MTASCMESPPGPRIVFEGKSYLYFGGTSYLGLAGHPEVIEAGCRALRSWGVHTATSRTGYGTSPALREAEIQAAHFFGTESAFYFGSGYMSNHIMIATLTHRTDIVLLESNAHYCIKEAAQLAGKPIVEFNKFRVSDIESNLKKGQRILLMADAVSPVTGQLAPLLSYLDLLSNYPNSLILLDDAHGFGVLGPQGRGLFDHLNLWHHVNGGPPCQGVDLFACGTLSKALGGFGGIIPGTRDFVDQTRKASHYNDGASAPAAAVAGSSAKALEIARETPSLRDQLRENVVHLRKGLAELNLYQWVMTDDQPDARTAHTGVVAGDSARMQSIENALKEQGILVPFIRHYSGIPSEGTLRIALCSSHTQSNIDSLLSALNSILKNHFGSQVCGSNGRS